MSCERVLMHRALLVCSQTTPSSSISPAGSKIETKSKDYSARLSKGGEFVKYGR